jgi:PTS system nitrogen regulatory IIA component
MRLTDLLSPDRVGIQRVNGSSFDKEKAIGLLAKLIGDRDGVSIADIERALLDREQLQSTGIGEGVAIPHGALPQLTEQVAALLIVPDGVEFQAIDDAKVSILFGVITPKRATGEHLKTLARVSKLLRNKDFRHRLIHCTDAPGVFDLIRTEETASFQSSPDHGHAPGGGGSGAERISTREMSGVAVAESEKKGAP